MTKSSSKNLHSFRDLKEAGTKITMVTAYDYSMARCVAASQIDLILVGDSLGMVVLGYENTLKVSLDDMITHTAAVRRGAPQSFVVADLPYMSYHLSLDETKANAAALIIEGGADAVKLEGGSGVRLEAIMAILECEIPVCAHIGLTPQSVRRFGGFRVQGKSPEAHETLLRQALALEKAGVFMLVLEGIPESLGKEISQSLSIPTIGIGAGRYTDGQVLVYHDLLGHSDLQPKFVRSYASLDSDITQALNRYCAEVREGAFPGPENVYYPITEQ
ncbi:MAG: 3-methyl-2-oxobutanoate hydroxymethyltransferase [Candidatus Cloacimonetes bacterium]|nr:3-methyl-2-oxobutanoate hydroxymethyltransferase [Candidatus Cloacimonadota bacterium]